MQVHRGCRHQRLQVRVGRDDGGGRVHELAAGSQQGHQGERKKCHLFFSVVGDWPFSKHFGLKSSVHICGHSSEGTWLSGSPRNSSLDADCWFPSGNKLELSARSRSKVTLVTWVYQSSSIPKGHKGLETDRPCSVLVLWRLWTRPPKKKKKNNKVYTVHIAFSMCT